MIEAIVGDPRPWARAVPFMVAASLWFAVGCGRTDRSCPVTGQARVNGRSAEGLYVVFHPVGGDPGQTNPASARTARDGSFTLRVPTPGEYAVTAFWPRVTVEAGETTEGEDAFRGGFKDPRRPVRQVTIRERDDQPLLLDLKFDFKQP